MTKRKILSLLLTIVLIACAIVVVSCNNPAPGPEKTEWPEAGVYKFAAGTTECTLVLNEGDTFTLVYKNRSESGKYTLTDSTLVLTFDNKDKGSVTAKYSDTEITLEYDGANMLLHKNISYTVAFDVAGGSAVANQTVVNGQTATEPAAPTREDFEFLGWYVDSEFTSMFNFETPITADTTVYARWKEIPKDMQLPDPEITASASQISWNSIAGARSYLVEIVSPDGTVVFEQNVSATVVNVDFAQFEAAVYTVRVTAIAQTGEEDNSSKEISYEHNALAKATGFEVINPSLLVFNKVENAERYYITVVCGNPNHNHTDFDNGSNRFFSLENCVMGKDGIKVTVTAVAEGFAPSVSDTFVYKKELGSVSGLRLDEKNQTVVWDEVENAASYMVSVKCGDASHNHGFINVGSQTFVSVKECAPCEGGIIVKVYPVTNGYISPDASSFTYEKSGLQTPNNLTVNGTLISWEAVKDATSYEIKIGDKTYTATTNSYDMASLLNYIEGTKYTVSVRALSANAESLWTGNVEIRYYEMGDLIAYSQSKLTWAPVLGVAGYEIQVNDGEIISVAGGTTSTVIDLTKSGINTVKVRFVDGKVRSDWKSIDVYAYAVTFNTLGGSEIIVQYKAIGDIMTLPTPTKAGYTFDAWYNLPGGAASNGKVYNDSVFAESGEIVLYAQYVANKYEITYNYGLGGSGTAEKGSVSYEENFTLEVPTASTPTGAFGGWFSLPYGMGVQYTDAKGNSLAPWDSLEGAELYAFWVDDALTFTLTNVNGKPAYMVSSGDRISLVTEVTIPATYKGINVAMIAGNAFLNCTTLEVVNIPATIEQISSVSPFGGCASLKEINVYSVEGVNGRYWSEDGVLFDNGTSAVANPKLAVMPVAKLGSYTIPTGVTEIPEGAFANSNISKVVIPASMVKIGRNAFENCQNLVSVVFSAPAAGEKASSLVIAARAFSGCSSLEKIILPARLTEIKLQKYTVADDTIAVDNAENAFLGCTSLVSITVVSGNTSYKSVDGMLYSADGKTLLYCPATKTFADGKLEIPAGTQTIAPGAFMDCTGISEVTLPNTVTLVGECAFYGLAGLNKVTFGGNALVNLVIGKYAFRGCSNLSEIALMPGSRVSTISEGAFRDCTSLAAFTIPATATAIQADAFRGCTSLATITFESGAQPLAFGEDVFYNCSSLTSIELPANVSEIPGIFGGCASLTSVSIHKDNPYFVSDEEGVVFNKDKTVIIFFPLGKTGDYVLPSTVTTIANGVFRDVKLDSITIGNAITHIGDDAFRGSEIDSYIFTGEANTNALTIGDYAFYGASFDDITLPAHTKTIGRYAFAYTDVYDGIVLNDGVEILGDYAFYQSYAYYAVTIPASVKTIGAYCFSAESSAYSSYFPKVKLTAENSVLETIGFAAFYGNERIYSITIPASVTTIEPYAFYGAAYIETIEFAPNSSLKTIGAYAFGGEGYTYAPEIETITIPKSVTSIGAYAFANARYLETVYFEKGGTEDLVIGTSYVGPDADGYEVTLTGYTFYHTNYLEEVELPTRLVELKASSFEQAGYYSEFTVTFAENDGDIRLTTIGPRAFYYSNLLSITIPTSVRNLEPALDEVTGEYYDRMGIGEYAFYGCYETLSDVNFVLGGTAALTIGNGAFENCDKLAKITLPARLAPYTNKNGESIAPLANGADVFYDSYGNGLSSIAVENGCAYYVAVDDVLYSADMTELVLYPAKKDGTLEIPATVKKIHSRAFFYAEGLTEITFADGSALVEIGDEAFKRCKGLVSVVLPKNVTKLGAEAFAQCTKLETLTLSAALAEFDGAMINGCSAIKSINIEGTNPNFYSDNGVLYNGNKTTLLYYPANRDGESYTVLAGTVRIEANAFANNKQLTSVTLPEGLVEIGENAFLLSAELATVNIPGTVTLIDSWGFSNCYKLSNITFGEGNDKLIVNKYAFQSISAKNLSLPARLAYLGNYAFIYAGIENVEFAPGSQLVEIADQVFQGTDLVDVVLPDGVITIGNGIFTDCGNLESVVFGEGLVSLGSETFSDTDVKSVHFPSTLKTLGADTFKYISSLEEVTFAPGCQLESIPEGTFRETGITSIIIPATVKEIGADAFRDCESLISVTFEDNSVCLIIGDRAFNYCSALEDIKIPAAVSTIGEEAFEYCVSLTKITIPATVTQFGGSAFYGCSALADIQFMAKPGELPSYLFYGCPITEFKIPNTVHTIGMNAFGNTKLEAYTVEKGSATFSAVGGVLFNVNGTEIIAYPINKADETFVIPNTVTYIGEGTFGGATALRYIEFAAGGDAALTIGESAFADMTSLVKITLPERLAAIGEEAFHDCINLFWINLPANLTEENVGEDAFYGCERLVEVYNQSGEDIEAGDYYAFAGMFANALRVYTEGESTLLIDANGFVTIDVDGDVYLVGYTGNATEIVIPAGVEIINYAAFYDFADIISVVIPEGVVEIGDYAFYDCSNLVNVTFPVTLEKIGSDAFGYCYDLGNIVIPEFVTSIGSYAFSGASDACFFIKVASKPSGWSSSWKSSSARAIWGYTGEIATYTFEMNGGVAIDPISSDMPIMLPGSATKDGWYFAGWYTNPELTGSAVSGEYYDPANTTLYAKWIGEAEYLEQFLGKSFDQPIKLTAGVSVTKIIKKGEPIYFVLTVTETRSYTIGSSVADSSNNNPDMKCTMYDADRSEISSDDDGGPGYQFEITRTLYAGETYYFEVDTWTSAGGEFTITVE